MLPIKVLFLCTANSCRSQMAEGLLRHRSRGILEVASAGTHPKTIHPDAIRCMAEIGIDISRQRSKPVEAVLGQRFDYVITLCDAARETCPLFPGAARTIHWSLPDPAAATGNDEQRMLVFRAVREQLAAQLDQLLAEIMDGFLMHLAEVADTAHADASQREVS